VAAVHGDDRGQGFVGGVHEEYRNLRRPEELAAEEVEQQHRAGGESRVSDPALGQGALILLDDLVRAQRTQDNILGAGQRVRHGLVGQPAILGLDVQEIGQTPQKVVAARGSFLGEPVGEEEPEPVAVEPEPEAEPEAEAVEAPAPLVAVPSPPPEPAAVAPAPPPPEPDRVVAFPAAAYARQRWNVWELERLTRARAGADPVRDEELGFLLVYLRDFAAPDGSLPEEFDDLVRESFGDVVGVAGSR